MIYILIQNQIKISIITVSDKTHVKYIYKLCNTLYKFFLVLFKIYLYFDIIYVAIPLRKKHMSCLIRCIKISRF